MKLVYKISIVGLVSLTLGLAWVRRTEKEKCVSKFSKENLIAEAQAILDNGGNGNIWNLHELDTSEFYTVDDFFMSSTEKSKLVLIGGVSGGSSGSADNLLMIVECYEDEINVVWAGQFGDIIKNGIVDINNDGVKEVIGNSGSVWMGQCDEFNTIYNFSGESDISKQSEIIMFRSHAFSFLECGAIDLKNHVKGDTLQLDIKFDLVKKDKKYVIQENRTIKIHNGGEMDETILENMITKADTIYTIFN